MSIAYNCHRRRLLSTSAASEIICTVEARSPGHVALGRAIYALRLDAGMSQEELARRAGMHRTYIGGIERGERNVSFANLLKIANALGERPSKLLARYERLL
jgi:DNA-binding XRE family transcriptional regulator